jgi:hypothetical protein
MGRVREAMMMNNTPKLTTNIGKLHTPVTVCWIEANPESLELGGGGNKTSNEDTHF